jgi:hypothetical protein
MLVGGDLKPISQIWLDIEKARTEAAKTKDDQEKERKRKSKEGNRGSGGSDGED